MAYSIRSIILPFLVLIVIRQVATDLNAPQPDQYWKVTPPINYGDDLYAGWEQIPVEMEIEVYNGVDIGRTYAHSPALLAVNDTVYIVHSSALVDEDSMGMELWGAISTDGGQTWSKSATILPSALLLNQTNERNFTYWCSQGIVQRAIGALSILQLNSSIWAVGQTANFFCWGEQDIEIHGAGRIARQLSSLNGSAVGDPCWSVQNDWTNITQYNETVYGTEYGMAICKYAAELNAILEEPSLSPAWSD